MKRMVPVVALACLLSGCGVPGRLANVGKAPKMTPTDDPGAPLIEPSLGQQAAAHRRGQAITEPTATASLFRTGAGSFLRDQRASKVGDILTIKINIADKAEVDNSTTRSRGGSETGGIAGLLGLETQLPKILRGQLPIPPSWWISSPVPEHRHRATRPAASRST